MTTCSHHRSPRRRDHLPRARHGRARANAKPKPPIPLKEAKLNIEHNATDNDTGFRGFIDSEGWKTLLERLPNAMIGRTAGPPRGGPAVRRVTACRGPSPRSRCRW
jgi:hypothetical protein